MPLLRKIYRRYKRPPTSSPEESADEPVLNISGLPKEDLLVLANLMGQTVELRSQFFRQKGKDYAVAYLESVIDPAVLQQTLNFMFVLEGDHHLGNEAIGEEKSADFDDIILQLAKGYAALFVAGEKYCRLIPAPQAIRREPQQPDHQRSVKGPKNGFIEDVRANLFMIRTMLKDKNLRIFKTTTGARTQTSVYVLYIEDLADPQIVQTVIGRIQAIKTDVIIGSSDLSQQIEDSWLSPFPQVEYCERPDVVNNSLAQGRIAILHESSPGVLLAPATFFELLDTPDDYFTSWSVSSSIIRFIRLAAVFFATFLPSLYIALTAYNHDFIPTSLALLIAISREGVPFPIPIEAFLVVSLLEILREAVLRLPSLNGILTGFTGIFLTFFAVQANYISAIMVMIIFFGIICSSVIPDGDLRISIRELQFFFMIMASLLGILGVAISFFYITIHAVNLKSFGIPYLSPVAPLVPNDWKSILLRYPSWAKPRMKSYHAQDQDNSIKTADRKEGVSLDKKPG